MTTVLLTRYRVVEEIRVRRVWSCLAPTEEQVGDSGFPLILEEEEDATDSPDVWNVSEWDHS